MIPETPEDAPNRPLAASPERLESWKEIAAYLNREVRTVQRWEGERGLPVHRIPGAKKGGVYASRVELDGWLDQKRNAVALSRSEPQTTVQRREPGLARWVCALASAGRALTSAPWQLYLAAITCVFYTAITWWIHLNGPEQTGWIAIPSAKGVLVEAVRPGTTAARAGILKGDRILEWDGMRLFGYSRLGVIQARVGRPYRITVDRAGAPQDLLMTLNGKDWTFWRSRDGARQLVILLSATLYLMLGFTLWFVRPRDPAARWGALCLAAAGIAVMHASSFNAIAGAFGLVRNLPDPLGPIFIAIASLSVGVVPALLITFLSVFPRGLFQNRWLWAAIWALNLARVGPTAYWLLFLTYTPESFHHFGWTADAVDAALFPQFLCALGILAWNVVHLGHGDAGRRARIIMAGLAVTMISALPSTLFGVMWLPAVKRLTPLYEASLFPLALSLFIPIFPISMVYAILRYRLFDIRLMVRQGLQYATARGVLRSLAPLTAVLLAADLLLHRNQPLAETLSQRRWLYSALVICTILLHQRRDVWLQALDRRFFREQYDARHLLRSVAEEARRVRDLNQVASLAMSHIDAALHPEFAAIVVRLPGEAAFRATAAVRSVPRPIPAASGLVGILRALGRPLEIQPGQSNWLKRQLLPQEADYVRKEGLEWIFPIVVDAEGPESLLVLGPKRSEEPYSREDQALLEALTANLALLSLKKRPPVVLSIATAANQDRSHRG